MALEATARTIGGSLYLLVPKNVTDMIEATGGDIFTVNVSGSQVTYTKTGRREAERPMGATMGDDKKFMEELEKQSGAKPGTYVKALGK